MCLFLSLKKFFIFDLESVRSYVKFTEMNIRIIFTGYVM